MTLGVIDVQSQVDCSGTLRTFLEFFSELAAGQVEVKAQLLLAAWQQIPTGFDLLGFKSFEVATSGRGDQSFGPELVHFQKSFDSSSPVCPLCGTVRAHLPAGRGGPHQYLIHPYHQVGWAPASHQP